MRALFEAPATVPTLRGWCPWRWAPRAGGHRAVGARRRVASASSRTCFEQAPGEGSIPAPVARAIVGALRTILYSRVRTRTLEPPLKVELQKLTPDMVAWIVCYYPTPAADAQPTAPKARRHGHLQGGRAPGTLSPSPRWAPRGLPRGEHNLPKGFVAHNQRERIFDAVANLTAAKGYAALSLEEIVAEAAISLQTFYEHFENKEEAFLATFEMGHAKATAAINRRSI